MSRPRFARRLRGPRALTLAFAPRLILPLSGDVRFLLPLTRLRPAGARSPRSDRIVGAKDLLIDTTNREIAQVEDCASVAFRSRLRGKRLHNCILDSSGIPTIAVLSYLVKPYDVHQMRCYPASTRIKYVASYEAEGSATANSRRLRFDSFRR